MSLGRTIELLEASYFQGLILRFRGDQGYSDISRTNTEIGYSRKSLSFLSGNKGLRRGKEIVMAGFSIERGLYVLKNRG